MRHSIMLVFIMTVLVVVCTAFGETPMPPTSADIQQRSWEAKWITCPDKPRREFGVLHFRKTFSLQAVPKSFVIHVSGDNRYELYVNGVRMATGPARGDLNHWRYETLDISSHLKAGENSLAAIVWNFAGLAPMAQMMHETAFLLQGGDESAAIVNTGDTWKVFPNDALELIPLDSKKVRGYFVAGPGERWRADRYPWGWQDTDYDDSTWKAASALDLGGPRGIRDTHSRWMLVPRTIPMMEEKQERLNRVVRAEGIEKPPDSFLQGQTPLTIPANAQATVLMDQSFLTTAYPELVTRGGRGAVITLAYSESLLTPEEPVWEKGQKKNRNETEGKVMLGLEDVFVPDGGQRRIFRPLWWRCYRYLQMEVKTSAEPLVIEDLRGLFTAYPMEPRAVFESDDPSLQQIWDVGWRTARLCAHETYMDTPYYEQLQYIGDTRIQALVSLYMTGDDRLVKNAIELSDESRTPEGLTQSRYPSFLPQYIPPFSLFWIGMMRDLWWYRGETEFLKAYLPGSRGVLDWFEARLTPSGLLGKLEWWNFTDWNSDFVEGVPPEDADGQSSILSLQFAMILREAADLETAFGSPERAQRYQLLAARVAASVQRHCWDPGRHLIADTPARKTFSQHANVLGVLTNAVPQNRQGQVMKAVLTDPKLTQASYYFRYYLFRALRKAGMGDRYLEQLKPWQEMLALGLTTWAEEPEIGHSSRSDCHAWSAHPNFDLLATVAGIEPFSSGFREVAIRPYLGRLKHVVATLPHPKGEIRVEYMHDGRKLEADITLPSGLSGWFYWEDNETSLRAGKQHLSF